MDAAWRSEDVTAHDARWAVSPAGREVIDALLDGGLADPLATATALRRHGLAPARAATAQSVAVATRDARAAGHPADTWWTPAALEQASRPVVSRWRARRYDGDPVVDLTAGCGGDARQLETHAATLLALETDPARLPLLRANLPPDVAVARADARHPPVRPSAWWAWADPARRVDGRRVRTLGQVRPAVSELVGQGFAGLGIAVAPGLALDDPDRPVDGELEFVQVDRQLVEATVWLGGLREHGPEPTEAWAPRGPAATSATLLPTGHHLRGTPTGPLVPVTDVGDWLAEPAPALVRARLADGLAGRLGLTRLARGRALFTGSTAVDSPWFRVEAVEAVVAARPATVRDALRALEPRPLELLTHGMEVDHAGWWRQLGRPRRGPDGRAIHLARLDDRHVAILTRRTWR